MSFLMLLLERPYLLSLRTAFCCKLPPRLHSFYLERYLGCLHASAAGGPAFSNIASHLLLAEGREEVIAPQQTAWRAGETVPLKQRKTWSF